ncbi:hypothetical protein [Devosia sp.]|uniref:hypothetical protein n=1 Tax=Devosia sp. TaxID=1871048 RepID=UPI0026076E67|nr:hypothetical protein [Devosia sp.]
MKHQRAEDLNTSAGIVALSDAITILDRREKITRWAAALDTHGGALNALRGIEYLPYAQRRAYRRGDSPLSIAFNDPVLRTAGLAGDTLGDAMDFFEISSDDAHQLLCDCHYRGSMTGRGLARRLRRFAAGESGGFLAWLGRMLGGHFA